MYKSSIKLNTPPLKTDLFDLDSVYYTVPKSVLMKSLVFLAVYALFSCSRPDCPDQVVSSGDTVKVIKFMSANKIPVIEGKINGKKAYFIVDSGASVSVLDITQDRVYNFNSYPLNEEAAGYGGYAKFYEVLGVRVHVGPSIVRTQFRSQDLSSIVELIRQHEGVRISGILGSDVWKDLDALIDYKSRTIAIR